MFIGLRDLSSRSFIIYSIGPVAESKILRRVFLFAFDLIPPPEGNLFPINRRVHDRR